MGTLMILRMRTSDVASATSDCAQVSIAQHGLLHSALQFHIDYCRCRAESIRMPFFAYWAVAGDTSVRVDMWRRSRRHARCNSADGCAAVHLLRPAHHSCAVTPSTVTISSRAPPLLRLTGAPSTHFVLPYPVTCCFLTAPMTHDDVFAPLSCVVCQSRPGIVRGLKGTGGDWGAAVQRESVWRRGRPEACHHHQQGGV